jgi:sugar lactone lactonase YvrE
VLNASGAYVTTLPNPTGGPCGDIAGVAIDDDGRIFVLGYNDDADGVFEYDDTFAYVATHDGLRARAIAVDNAGRLYLADFDEMVTVYDTNDFSEITTYASDDMGGDGFRFINDIAVDSDGSVFVTDAGYMSANRVVKLVWNAGETALLYDSQLGTTGNGDDQFDSPKSIAIGAGGAVYIADVNNSRIQKLSNALAPVTRWGGPGPGQFVNPTDIAQDSAGNIYVVDGWNMEVHKLASNGNPITKWQAEGYAEDAQLGAIAVSPGDVIYVLDWLNARFELYSTSGVFQSYWSPAELQDPEAIVIDADGSIYVSDSDTLRIEKFNSAGVHQMGWTASGDFEPGALAVSGAGILYVSDEGGYTIRAFSTSGTPEAVTFPESFANYLAVDAAGRILADAGVGDFPVDVLSTSGALIGGFGEEGLGPGKISGLTGLWASANGSVLLSDEENGVMRFVPANGRTPDAGSGKRSDGNGRGTSKGKGRKHSKRERSDARRTRGRKSDRARAARQHRQPSRRD